MNPPHFVSVILPSVNEAENLRELIPRVKKQCDRLGHDSEVIVVDAYSSDETPDVVRSFPYAHLLLREKQGIGDAHHFGYLHAKGDILITMDADQSHDPGLFEEIIKLVDNDHYDIVVCSRHVTGGGIEGKSFLRRQASNVANNLASFILGLPISDKTNGYRAITHEVFQKCKDDLHCRGNSYLTELFYVAVKAHGFRYIEIPSKFVERRIGQTKLRLGRESAKYLASIIRIRIRRFPKKTSVEGRDNESSKMHDS